MGQVPSWINKIPEEIINYYRDGHNLHETANYFGNCSYGAVYRLLIKYKEPVRGRGHKWTEDQKQKASKHRTGITSPAKGKKWKIKHRIKRPNQSGTKNHFWKGGKTKLSFKIKTLPEYSHWKMQILKKDNFTCQICGAKNKKGIKHIFDVHHIYPLSKIIDDFRIQTIEAAINCEELWDINNGRCLCRKCHKKTDSWGQNLFKHI